MAAPAAVVVQVVAEALPVLAVVDLAHLPVLAQVVARRAHRVQLPLLVRLLVLAKARLPVLAPVVLDGAPVLAHPVVEPEGPLQHLLSRRSFSAAMARNTP